jgi:hypothetical protein
LLLLMHTLLHVLISAGRCTGIHFMLFLERTWLCAAQSC